MFNAAASYTLSLVWESAKILFENQSIPLWDRVVEDEDYTYCIYITKLSVRFQFIVWKSVSLISENQTIPVKISQRKDVRGLREHDCGYI